MPVWVRGGAALPFRKKSSSSWGTRPSPCSILIVMLKEKSSLCLSNNPGEKQRVDTDLKMCFCYCVAHAHERTVTGTGWGRGDSCTGTTVRKGDREKLNETPRRRSRTSPSLGPGHEPRPLPTVCSEHSSREGRRGEGGAAAGLWGRGRAPRPRGDARVEGTPASRGRARSSPFLMGGARSWGSGRLSPSRRPELPFACVRRVAAGGRPTGTSPQPVARPPGASRVLPPPSPCGEALSPGPGRDRRRRQSL